MSPFVIVLIAGMVLHTIVGVITRTPEQDQTPIRWKAWHTFLAGIVSTAVIIAVMIGYYLVTGIVLPYWALLLATDLLTLAWKVRKHWQRVRELRALQGLFDQPSLGEGA